MRRKQRRALLSRGKAVMELYWDGIVSLATIPANYNSLDPNN